MRPPRNKKGGGTAPATINVLNLKCKISLSTVRRDLETSRVVVRKTCVPDEEPYSLVMGPERALSEVEHGNGAESQSSLNVRM